MTYYEGSTVTLQVTFRDIAGDLVDPSSVDLFVQDPSGNVTTPSPSNPSVGVYEAQVDLDEPGWYDYRWEGTTTEGTVVCEGRVCAETTSILVSA